MLLGRLEPRRCFEPREQRQTGRAAEKEEQENDDALDDFDLGVAFGSRIVIGPVDILGAGNEGGPGAVLSDPARGQQRAAGTVSTLQKFTRFLKHLKPDFYITTLWIHFIVVVEPPKQT